MPQAPITLQHIWLLRKWAYLWMWADVVEECQLFEPVSDWLLGHVSQNEVLVSSAITIGRHAAQTYFARKNVIQIGATCNSLYIY